MTTTLDQPAGKAVEAMTDAPADMAQALARLVAICRHLNCQITVTQSIFPRSTWPVKWIASADYGSASLCGHSTVSADDAVNEWVKAALAKRNQPVPTLPELPVESVMAREPYDARSPNAEEREQAEFDESNVGERHDGGPL